MRAISSPQGSRWPSWSSREHPSSGEVCCVFPVAPAFRCRECHRIRPCTVVSLPLTEARLRNSRTSLFTRTFTASGLSGTRRPGLGRGWRLASRRKLSQVKRRRWLRRLSHLRTRRCTTRSKRYSAGLLSVTPKSLKCPASCGPSRARGRGVGARCAPGGASA